VTSSECAKTSLLGSSLKLRIEKFEIKTESVKTSKSVSGTNSDDLPENSETSVFVGLSNQIRKLHIRKHIFRTHHSRNVQNSERLISGRYNFRNEITTGRIISGKS